METKIKEKTIKQTIAGVPFKVVCGGEAGFNRHQRRAFEAIARRSPNYKKKKFRSRFWKPNAARR
jgi:hypothetical protein